MPDIEELLARIAKALEDIAINTNRSANAHLIVEELSVEQNDRDRARFEWQNNDREVNRQRWLDEDRLRTLSIEGAAATNKYTNLMLALGEAKLNQLDRLAKSEPEGDEG